MNKYYAFNVLVGNGMFEIYRGPDGKLHIRWILPDPPPDVLQELRAVAAVLHEAHGLTNPATAAKFQQFAENLLNSRAAELSGIFARQEEVARAS